MRTRFLCNLTSIASVLAIQHGQFLYGQCIIQQLTTLSPDSLGLGGVAVSEVRIIAGVEIENAIAEEEDLVARFRKIQGNWSLQTSLRSGIVVCSNDFVIQHDLLADRHPPVVACRDWPGCPGHFGAGDDLTQARQKQGLVARIS